MRRLVPRLPTLLLVAWLGGAGCASTGSLPGSWRRDLEASLAAVGLAPSEVLVPFELDASTRAWLSANPPPGTAARERLNALLGRLTAQDGLGITYERGQTGTASEVFALRRANCLGFMSLFVALARELGYPATFLAVDAQPLFDRAGDLVLISEHVVAGFGARDDLLVLDFYEGPPRTYAALRELSDLAALARFHSNRGVEVLQAGQARAALPWLEKAIRLDPALGSAWVNLGVARRRTGDLEGAEAAYRQALVVAPGTASAYENLAALLRLRGQTREAAGLLALAARLSGGNPFNYLNLGDWSREAGRLEEARAFYRRALALDGDRAELHAALGELELAQERVGRARRALERARKLDPTDPRVERLAAALAAERGEP
jgi:Flp pilus assembly protein TadD